jgi:alpha-glucosidase
MPADWAALTVEKQQGDPDSTLSFFQKALELRGKRGEFDGDKFEWLTAPSGALAFRGRGGLVCALNSGKRPIALPAGELILASAPLVDGQLPPDSAAWLV